MPAAVWAKRLAWLVILCPAFILCLAFWQPASYLASATLEWQDPGGTVPRGDADAIVVVAGGDAEARYRHAAWLYTHWRALFLAGPAGVVAERRPRLDDLDRVRFEQYL
jgi:uncharacterized SAM-binding protein YcdF (DUF218 family)